MKQDLRLEYEGRTYEWNGQKWFDSKTYAVPPQSVSQALNSRAATLFAEDDDTVDDPFELLQRAKAARDAGQLQRAETLLLRVLEHKPDHHGALAIYTSLLRKRGTPERALEVSEPYRHVGYAPLLVSRAAAFCDLERWEEAKRTVGRALAQGGDSGAFSVANRIKANRPELYE